MSDPVTEPVPPPDSPLPTSRDFAGSAPVPGVRRYRLTIAYDGTLFHGWQKQSPPGQEPLRTVQGVVEAAVAEATQQRINLVGASRTDAGVHALGQVAQFDAATRIPVERIAQAINSRLPADVEVLDAGFAPPDFEVITQAKSKQYRYRIFNSSRRPLHLRNYVYHCWWPLDVAKMNDAAARFVGTHDFAAFTAAGHGRETTVRTVHACFVERRAGQHGDRPGAGVGECQLPIADFQLKEGVPRGAAAASGNLAIGNRQSAIEECHIVVRGGGFLYNMVRIMAGTLLEVGRGAMPPEAIDAVIAGCDRRQAGPTLPPEGLWLEWIQYGEDAEAIQGQGPRTVEDLTAHWAQPRPRIPERQVTTPPDAPDSPDARILKSDI